MFDNNKVAIIDYELCNLFSVVSACKHVGLCPVITSDPEEIMSCGGAILPGVGAFGEAIQQIRKKKLDQVIYNFVDTGRPFMGVCLGLQLLFDKSEEFGEFDGLGIISGVIKRIPAQYGKVPQIGWNTLELSTSSESDGMAGCLTESDYVYFIHSYYAEPYDDNDVLTYTNYGGLRYCSSISRGNVSAFQFHPEKSGEVGLKIYRRFKELVNDRCGT